MSHSTPSGIAETSYQDSRARRYRDVQGLPDPRRAWKPNADPSLLSAIINRAFDAYIEELLPLADRPAIAMQLDQDLARRRPLDDMVVLERYGFAGKIDRVAVDVGGARWIWFDLPSPRPVINMRGWADRRFTAIEPFGLVVVGIPAPLRAIFEPVVDAHARRQAEFTMAAAWPVRFHHEHKRRPTWAEIEAAFPRIGAWMAKMRKS